MIVLDACVLIAHLDSTDAHHEQATQLLAAAATESFAASALTLAEVLVGPSRAGWADRAAATLRRLGVRPVAIDDGSPARLAALRASTKLTMPDCCVLLAAQQTAASLVTFDDRLVKAAEQLGIPVRATP